MRSKIRAPADAGILGISKTVSSRVGVIRGHPARFPSGAAGVKDLSRRASRAKLTTVTTPANGGVVDVTFSHLGICVSDLERSMRFYCEGLGFELAQSHTVGREFGRLMEVDDVVLQSRFVRRDGVSIELLHFDSPGHSASRDAGP